MVIIDSHARAIFLAAIIICTLYFTTKSIYRSNAKQISHLQKYILQQKIANKKQHNHFSKFWLFEQVSTLNNLKTLRIISIRNLSSFHFLVNEIGFLSKIFNTCFESVVLFCERTLRFRAQSQIRTSFLPRQTQFN